MSQGWFRTPLTRSLIALWGAALYAASLGSAAATREDVHQPFQGVTYIDREDTAPRAVHMHVVQIDLMTPGIRFTLSPHAGSREVVRQRTLDFLRAQHAQVAAPPDFGTLPDRHRPLAALAADRRDAGVRATMMAA